LNKIVNDIIIVVYNYRFISFHLFIYTCMYVHVFQPPTRRGVHTQKSKQANFVNLKRRIALRWFATIGGFQTSVHYYPRPFFFHALAIVRVPRRRRASLSQKLSSFFNFLSSPHPKSFPSSPRCPRTRLRYLSSALTSRPR